MCMLTVLPQPELLDAEHARRLLNGAECNPHGHGWAAIIGSRVETFRTMDADEAVNTFTAAAHRATGPAIFHSRWSTHGSRTLPNVHPFPVRKFPDTFLAHNGIMPAESWPEKGDDRSDTRVFADDILPRQFRRLDSPRVRCALSGWLKGNKIAILTTNPRLKRNLYVFGYEAGEWVDGVWYSNGDHEGWQTRYGKYTSGIGTGSIWGSNYSREECKWCHAMMVNNWDVCEACGTCQDCFEPSQTCQCFEPESSVIGTPRPDDVEDIPLWARDADGALCFRTWQTATEQAVDDARLTSAG